MLGFVLFMLAIGLGAGIVGRALVPGMALSIGGAVVLGTIGSLIGGFVGYVLTHRDPEDSAFHVSGIVGSILGVGLALFVHRVATAPDQSQLA